MIALLDRLYVASRARAWPDFQARIGPMLQKWSAECERQALERAAAKAEATIGLDYSDRERNIVGRAVAAMREGR